MNQNSLRAVLPLRASRQCRSLHIAVQCVEPGSHPDRPHHKQICPITGAYLFGGEGGIRTLERFDPLHTFQACSFSHSDTSPI